MESCCVWSEPAGRSEPASCRASGCETWRWRQVRHISLRYDANVMAGLAQEFGHGEHGLFLFGIALGENNEHAIPRQAMSEFLILRHQGKGTARQDAGVAVLD